MSLGGVGSEEAQLASEGEEVTSREPKMAAAGCLVGHVQQPASPNPSSFMKSNHSHFVYQPLNILCNITHYIYSSYLLASIAFVVP